MSYFLRISFKLVLLKFYNYAKCRKLLFVEWVNNNKKYPSKVLTGCRILHKLISWKIELK